MGVEFSNRTIINVYTDTISSSYGTVTRNNNLILGTESWVRFIKSYSTTDDLIKTNQIRLVTLMNVINGQSSSRYSSELTIKVNIKHYKVSTDQNNATIYSDGIVEQYLVTPYNTDDTDGLLNTYIFDVSTDPIKNITVTIYNNSEDYSASVVSFGLGQSLSVTESLGKSLAIETTLQGIDNLNNGLLIHFTTGDLKLKTLKDTNNNFAGYNVNDEAIIYWRDINSDL